MKTGVIVHGCNLQIENWRHVAWGDPPDSPGRIPQGVLVAHQCNADLIVFGTGASSKPFQFGDQSDDEIPLLEADYSLRYLQEFFDQLAQFDVIRNRLGSADSADFQNARKELTEKVVVDIKSRNTTEEIENALDRFLENDIDQVVMVSSPSHIIRCLRDASAICASNPRYRKFRHQLRAVPSVTCYEGSTPADVVVVEPPHRPDRHVLPTHRRIQRMLELQKMSEEDLVSLIADFDDLLQRYEHRFFRQDAR